MPGLDRNLNRRCRRAPRRRCVRLLTRRTNGGPRPRPINHLAHALQGLTRAIRARRRLMRFAPHVFDRALVDRETAARAATAVRQAELEQALNKIYGTAAPSPPTDAPCTDAPTSVLCPPLSPWPKSRHSVRAVLGPLNPVGHRCRDALISRTASAASPAAAWSRNMTALVPAEVGALQQQRPTRFMGRARVRCRSSASILLLSAFQFLVFQLFPHAWP